MTATSHLILRLVLTEGRVLSFSPPDSPDSTSVDDLAGSWKQILNQKVLVFAHGEEMVCVPSREVVRVDLNVPGNGDFLNKALGAEGDRVYQEVSPAMFHDIQARNKTLKGGANANTGKEAAFLIHITLAGGQNLYMEGWVQEVKSSIDQRKNLMSVFDAPSFVFRTVNNGLGLINPQHILSLQFPTGGPVAPTTSFRLTQNLTPQSA